MKQHHVQGPACAFHNGVPWRHLELYGINAFLSSVFHCDVQHYWGTGRAELVGYIYVQR